MRTPKYALLIAESTNGIKPYNDPWSKFLSNVESFKKPANVEALGEGAWQIPLDGGLVYFSAIVSAASQANIRVRALFFKKAPEWVTHLPEPVKGPPHL
jgi:hypothetical protein